MHYDKTHQIDYVDCSSLCSFSRCPFRYMLSRQLGLKQKDRSKIALTYGTIMHEVLPMCYEYPLQACLDKFDSLWSLEDYGEHDKKRNTPCAHRLIENFHLARHGDKSPYSIVKIPIKQIDIEDSLTEGEIPFLIDIGGAYPFAGRIDMPVRLKQNDSLWALDFKTSGEVSDRFFQGFENHPQALGYSLALSVLTSQPVAGFMVEAVRVAPIPKRVSTVPPNQWHPVYVPEHKLTWFIDWTRRLSEEIALCNKTHFWPKNPTGCAPYGQFGMPGYTCDYKSLCDCGDNWQNEIPYYDQDPWHPFKMPPPETPCPTTTNTC